MFFHSISSLLLFLPFIFITYPLIKKINIYYSNLFLLLFSLFFYSFDIPLFLIPLLISGISDYLISKKIININNQENRKKQILLLMSILINITLLIIFKYSIILSNGFDFFGINYLSNSFKSIILPAGISFYTFQTLSFSIDSYKGKIKKIPSLIDYLLYVCYFPQLVAGPILRPKEFFNTNAIPFLNKNNSNFKNGFSRICFGLFLKLCLADELSIFNDVAFESNFYNLGFIDSWTMAFGFGLQIYFDFSAYSHMAIGISNIIGLQIKENFIFPYSSNSVSEFWKRWHISLSLWVSDYLYKFLNSKITKYFLGILPLLITWTIMGIWHGASLRFAFWGLLNGLLIVIYRLFKRINFPILKSKFISFLLTLFSIMSTWIYFRSTSWEQANYLYITLFNINKLELGLSENYYLIVFIFTISTLIAGSLWNSKYITSLRKNEIINIISSAIALGFAFIFINRQNSFIYFQF